MANGFQDRNGEGDSTRRARINIETIDKKWKRRLTVVITACALVTGLAGVIALGSKGQKAIDGRATTADLDALRQRTAALEAHHEDDDRRLSTMERDLKTISTGMTRLLGLFESAQPKRRSDGR